MKQRTTDKKNSPRSPQKITAALLGTTSAALRRQFRSRVSKKWQRLLRIIFFPIINPWMRYTLLALFLASCVGLVLMLRELPSPHNLTTQENYAVSTQIFDRNGTLLYEIYADENRIPASIETLPAYVYQASISIEDQNFYKHFGFDVVAITRAAYSTLTGKRLEGGSTITQQLVKNALLTSERSLTRKAKEAILSVFTEMI